MVTKKIELEQIVKGGGKRMQVTRRRGQFGNHGFYQPKKKEKRATNSKTLRRGRGRTEEKAARFDHLKARQKGKKGKKR